MKKDNLNFIDKAEIIYLAIFLIMFRPIIKKVYLQRKVYNPIVYNESHVFFFRNGKRLIKKFKKILESNGYPETSLDYGKLIEKLRSGYSFSRYGDGEYSIIRGKLNQRVYFDKATNTAKQKLIYVLENPIDNHLLGLIHPNVVAKQLTFANTLSMFTKVSSTGLKPRMPIFAEYDDQMLSVYNKLSKIPNNIFEAGLFRNIAQQQHSALWEDKDILYVIGSLNMIKKRGITVDEMFQHANSIHIIETVTENALSEYYEEILEKIVSYPAAKNKMILLSQGMAGTVLAYDLAKMGYHAIDLGQPFYKYKPLK